MRVATTQIGVVIRASAKTMMKTSLHYRTSRGREDNEDWSPSLSRFSDPFQPLGYDGGWTVWSNIAHGDQMDHLPLTDLSCRGIWSTYAMRLPPKGSVELWQFRSPTLVLDYIPKEQKLPFPWAEFCISGVRQKGGVRRVKSPHVLPWQLLT